MSNVIVINGAYDNEDALTNVFNYAYKKSILWSGTGVRTTDLGEAIKSMQYVKQYWDKTDGKELCHIVINLGGNTPKYMCYVPEVLAEKVALSVSRLIYSKGYQNCYFKHISDQNVLHFHFVINNVNLNDGKKLHSHSELAVEIHNYLIDCYPELDWRGVKYHTS